MWHFQITLAVNDSIAHLYSSSHALSLNAEDWSLHIPCTTFSRARDLLRRIADNSNIVTRGVYFGECIFQPGGLHDDLDNSRIEFSSEFAVDNTNRRFSLVFVIKRKLHPPLRLQRVNLAKGGRTFCAFGTERS